MSKVSKLKDLQDPKAATPSKPQIIIFGKSGVGKTWGALDFPNCVYVDTEGGANLSHYTDKLSASGGKYFGPKQGALDFRTVIELAQDLATEKHPYKTLVIDSFSKLYNNEIALEGERLEESGTKNEFGRDKKPAVNLTKRLMSWLARLDMNVILICHQKDEWGKDAKGERSQIGVTYDGHEKQEYDLHLCLQITKQGPDRKAFIRKSRLTGFPDGSSFKWSYAEFAERYGKDIIEAEAKPITLATPEQVAEIVRLLEVVKIDPADIDKWKAKAGAETFAEFTTEQAAGVIGALTKKLNPTK